MFTQMKLKALCKQYGFTQEGNGFKYYSGSLNFGEKTEIYISGKDILIQAYKWHYTADGDCIQERDIKALDIKQAVKYLTETFK